MSQEHPVVRSVQRPLDLQVAVVLVDIEAHVTALEDVNGPVDGVGRGRSIASAGMAAIVEPMVDLFGSNTNCPGPDAYGSVLCTILREASEDWSEVNLSDSMASVQGVLSALVLSGQIQLRLKVLARGLPDEPEVHAVCVVTGNYRKVLPEAIRAAVPNFSGRLAVHPKP